MELKINLATAFAVVLLVGAATCEIYFKKGAPFVKLPNKGLISGKMHLSRDGRPYNAFLGIPYATVPERFQAPQPITEPWQGVKSAITMGSLCPQMQFENGGKGGASGDEECLFLNIYVPMNATTKKGYPVMFWIHGGGFTYGTGIGYGAKLLMDEDVILVTINYRLGVWGFLSTGDEVVPGNAGMKDQVEALRWVQANIRAFGGDPGKVTIFGESAGGAAVHYLMLSPTAKGLFHRGIAQSGSAFSLWAYQSNPRSNAVRLATHLNCPTTGASPAEITSEEMLTCFKAVGTTELTTAATNFIPSWPENLKAFFFVPTAEPVPSSASKNVPFLTESPMEVYTKQSYVAEVPLMIGATEDEGCILYAGLILRNSKSVSDLNTNWNGIAPSALDFDKHFPEDKQLVMSEAIRKFYFGDKLVGEETRDALSDLYSDELILQGVVKAAIVTASRGKRNPVYLYQYAYPGPVSILSMAFNMKPIEKVGHGDELQHQFHFGPVGLPLNIPEEDSDKPETPQEAFSKNFLRLWSSFAAEGEPKHTWGTSTFRKWKSISRAELNGGTALRWFRIDENPTSVDDPYKDRMAFWDELLADYYASTTTPASTTSSEKTEL